MCAAPVLSRKDTWAGPQRMYATGVQHCCSRLSHLQLPRVVNPRHPEQDLSSASGAAAEPVEADARARLHVQGCPGMQRTVGACAMLQPRSIPCLLTCRSGSHSWANTGSSSGRRSNTGCGQVAGPDATCHDPDQVVTCPWLRSAAAPWQLLHLCWRCRRTSAASPHRTACTQAAAYLYRGSHFLDRR